MKKLFALLAAVCLFAAANVFATSNQWVSSPASGEFTAGIYCQPTWGIDVTSPGLGNFFAGNSNVAIPSGSYLTANLTGPGGTVGYVFSVTPGGTGSGQTATTYPSVNGADLLTSFQQAGSPFSSGFTIYSTEDAGANSITGNWTVALNGTGSAFGCENNTGLQMVYTPSTISTIASATGTLHFEVTAQVTVSI
jgi:hypothetical protein